MTDAPALGDAAASLGEVVAAPALGAGVVTVAPALGELALGEAALGEVVLGEAALGEAVSGAAVVVVLGEVVLGEVVLGAIVLLGVVLLGEVLVFAAAVSAIAPLEVLVVVPVLDFLDVSLGVVCCAAAGIDSAVSRTAASAYRCAIMVSPARCLGVCRLFSTDSQPVTAQTMHMAQRNVNFSRERWGQ